MKPTDEARFGQLIIDVMKYYRQDATPFLIDTWWLGCQRFTYGQVSAALSAHAADPDRGKFAPRLSDVTLSLVGSRKDRATVAWGKVYDAMSRVGGYQDVVFWDPVIHAVVQDMGGWPKLCRTDLKDLSYTQHRFMELHASYSDRGVEGYPRVLMGDRSPDVEYEKKGLPLPRHALVGDPELCAEVFRGGGDARVDIAFLPVAALAALGAPKPALALGSGE